MNLYKRFSVLVGVLAASLLSCTKEKTPSGSGSGATPPRRVVYLIKGTKFNLNYIDSNNIFQQNVIMEDSFHYDFMKGAGGNIGISITPFSPADTIFSWEIYIEGKLYANAFSEGGAYMVVPYTLF